jgi:hypothetical protein
MFFKSLRHFDISKIVFKEASLPIIHYSNIVMCFLLRFLILYEIFGLLEPIWLEICNVDVVL